MLKMDKSSDITYDFEVALKKSKEVQSSSFKQTLYSSDTNSFTNNYKIGDVILSVSKQMKALHSADCVNKQRQDYTRLNKVKSPGKSLSSSRTFQKNILNEFETQCVSDTQMADIIEIIEIVEAQEDNMDTVKEFDATFYQKFNHTGDEPESKKELKNCNKYSDNEEIHIKTMCLHINTTVNKQNVPHDIKCIVPNAMLQDGDGLKANNIDDQKTVESCKEFLDTDDLEHFRFEALGDFENSPILSKMNPLVFKSTQSLVYKLDSFEKFEAIALPIIEEYPDLQVAKRIINSQIENKELLIETNADPFRKNQNHNKSPILKSNIIPKFHENISIPIFNIREEKSKQSIAEDEILFSSDEENYLSTNDGEDMPLSCALQTSFYDCAGVLDKTLYICSDSFIKAQNDFSEKELENIKLDKVANLFDDTINSMDAPKENINASSICVDRNSLCGNIFVGFKKANGNKIDISENAIQKGLELFRDIDISHEHSDNKLKLNSESLSCKGTKEVKNTEKLTSQCRPLIEITKRDIYNESQKAPTINDSEDTLVKINDDNIIQEFETNLVENVENISFNQTENELRTVSKSNNLGTKKRTYEDIDKFENIYSISKLPGFKTASNKSIAVSEKALLKYQNVLDGLDFTDTLEPNHASTHEGFSTPSNKEIAVTQGALLESKTIFENIANMDSDNNNSQKCLEVAAAPFKSESSHVIVTCKQALSSSFNKSDNVSEENMKNIRNTSTKVYKPGICQGFLTANNKPIKVSSKLIDKYKNIFEEIDKCEMITNNNKSPTKYKPKLPTCQKPRVTQTAIVKSKNLINNSKENTSFNNVSHTFQGFQTAGHKKINIPIEKIAYYSKVFEGIDIDMNGYKNLPTNSPTKAPENSQFVEIKSAIKRDISLSEMGMTTKGNEFEHGRESEIANKQENVQIHSQKYCIFQTASRKPISVTEEAFEASQKVLNGTNIEIDKEQGHHWNAAVGFKTASKREIDISKQTLDKAKCFFDGIIETPTSELKILGDHVKSKLQFQTANNKTVNVSKEAIISSQKKLNSNGFQTTNNKNMSMDTTTMKASDCIDFNEILQKHTRTSSKPKLINYSKSNIHKDVTEKPELNSLINDLDTQIINNFDQALYTEDFLKETSLKPKRSGSPILHCPNAKKFKFKPPTNVSKIIKPDAYQNNMQASKQKPFLFDCNYKKNKKYRLQDLQMLEERCKSNTNTQFVGLDFENILQFEFIEERNDMTGVKLSTSSIREMFSESVNKKIIPKGWIENHMKLIIWKLLSYEIKYPKYCRTACSVKNVIQQLKYRYDRELYNVQRPAFRKILERDDVSTKTMVVCVVGVYIDGVFVSSVANSTDTIELLLTDGWYCIKACIDKLLAKYVFEGKITAGTKLVIHGAELINCEQGISPWEDTSSARLKLFSNSTRRARWDARLGYHGNQAILTQLSAVKPDGGKVSKLRVFVTRVYPTLYVEKFDDGSTVTRSETLESIHQMKYESDRQMLLEKIYEEIEKELYEQASLTESQLRSLQNHMHREKEKQMERIQQKVREKIKNSTMSVARNVVPLMKIRVASVEKDFKMSKVMISIWRPNEELQEIVTEGKWIQIYNIVPTGVRYSEIQLSASRQSIFQNCQVDDPMKNTISRSLLRRYYPIRDLTKKILNTDYNEIDTVGFVFAIEPSSREYETSKQLFQNVFLADENKNIICVNFWGGIKKFGFVHILETGEIVSCINLQKRSGNTVKSIPQYRATEFSYFTKTPKNDCLRVVSKELNKIISVLDKRKFIDDCAALKNKISHIKHGNDVSPYQMNNSDYNISKNKMFIDSPIVKENNLNLSGLDFESTFKQKDTQEMTPQEQLRKKKVNDKIAKLKMYGEPPPLSPIHIMNISKNAENDFKSPLTTRNNIQVTTTGKSSNLDKENSNIETSPVLPFRKSGVKPTVNPVRLNFNNVVNVHTADPFADDFDASPPLSLE